MNAALVASVVAIVSLIAVVGATVVAVVWFARRKSGAAHSG